MNKDVKPFNRYYFLQKLEDNKKDKTGFYMPDSAIKGNYELYKVHRTPLDGTLNLSQDEVVMVMQTLVESAKVLPDLYFCPECAVICRIPD